MRLIDADVLKQHIDKLPALPDGNFAGNHSALKALINMQPTVQPEPKEGHWIRTDCGLDVECKCSKCGYRDFVEPRDEYWFKRNYCPNCGRAVKWE